jgi:hypothetical protein
MHAPVVCVLLCVCFWVLAGSGCCWLWQNCTEALKALQPLLNLLYLPCFRHLQ